MTSSAFTLLLLCAVLGCFCIQPSCSAPVSAKVEWRTSTKSVLEVDATLSPFAIAGQKSQYLLITASRGVEVYSAQGGKYLSTLNTTGQPSGVVLHQTNLNRVFLSTPYAAYCFDLTSPTAPQWEYVFPKDSKVSWQAFKPTLTPSFHAQKGTPNWDLLTLFLISKQILLTLNATSGEKISESAPVMPFSSAGQLLFTEVQKWTNLSARETLVLVACSEANTANKSFIVAANPVTGSTVANLSVTGGVFNSPSLRTSPTDGSTIVAIFTTKVFSLGVDVDKLSGLEDHPQSDVENNGVLYVKWNYSALPNAGWYVYINTAEINEYNATIYVRAKPMLYAFDFNGNILWQVQGNITGLPAIAPEGNWAMGTFISGANMEPSDKSSLRLLPGKPGLVDHTFSLSLGSYEEQFGRGYVVSGGYVYILLSTNWGMQGDIVCVRCTG